MRGDRGEKEKIEKGGKGVNGLRYIYNNNEEGKRKGRLIRDKETYRR